MKLMTFSVYRLSDGRYRYVPNNDGITYLIGDAQYLPYRINVRFKEKLPC